MAHPDLAFCFSSGFSLSNLKSSQGEGEVEQQEVGLHLHMLAKSPEADADAGLQPDTAQASFILIMKICFWSFQT